MKNLLPSIILGVAIVIFGLCLKSGIDNFANRDRKVTVKGLSEVEVPADKVTWNLSVYVTGNELSPLYERMTATTQKVISFLKANGIKDEEISVNPPSVDDRISNRWGTEKIPFNYKITTPISVISSNIEVVRALVDKQGELLKEGIALGDRNSIHYDYTGFKEVKPKMIEESIANAQSTAEQFARNSGSRLGKIITADQGQFSITSTEENPSQVKVRVVSTIVYALKN